MKIKELIKDLDGGINIDELSIDEMHFLEKYFFSKGDYQNKSIDFCINKKWNFWSTINNANDMIKRFVVLKCPLCNKEMIPFTSSTNDTTHTATFVCPTCMIEGRIKILNDGGIHFDLSEKRGKE